MSALLDRSPQEVAGVAAKYAQASLNSAVREAVEEVDRERARRTRRRGIVGSLIGIGIGAALGYSLRDSDVEVPESSELPRDARDAIEEVTGTGRPTRRQRLRDAAPKAGAVGAAAISLYLLRRRTPGPREMVEQARQRPGRAGGRPTGTGEAGESAGTGTNVGEPEAVAGGSDDAGRMESETTTSVGAPGEEGDEAAPDEDAEERERDTGESESGGI